MKEKLSILGIRLLEFIFHPLIVVCYAAIVVMECDVFPFMFVSTELKKLVAISFLIMTFIIPMFYIILLKHYNFIKSYSNFTTRDLMVLLFSTSLFFAIMHIFLSLINAPSILQIIPMLAIANNICISIISIKTKVNVYSMALSSLLTYFIFVATAYNSNLLFAIIATSLTIGIINYVFIEHGINTLLSSAISCGAGIIITSISILLIK